MDGEATIDNNGTYSITTPTSAQLVADTSWNLAGSSSRSSTSLDFSVAGGKPQDMLFGPPGLGNQYSLKGAPAVTGHNPYYFETVTFDIKIPGLLATDKISSLSLLFGTIPDTNSNLTLTLESGAVPEPDTLYFLGSGVALIAAGLYRKRPKR